MNPSTRRRLAALCLLAWVPLALAWAIIWPTNPEDTGAAFTSAAAHNGAWQLAASLMAVCFAVAVPALVATLALVDGRRGRRLATTGALLAAAGFVADSMAGMFSLMMAVLAGEPDRANMLDAWNTFGSRPASLVTVVFILLGHLGLILLALGLWRARLTGWWVPLVIFAGMVVETVVPSGHHGSVATAVLIGAGFVGIFRALWSPAPAPVTADAPQAVPVPA